MTTSVLLSGLVVLVAGAGQEPGTPAGDRQSVPALQKAQLEAAAQAYRLTLEVLKNTAKGDAERVYQWSQRWMKAQQAATGKPAEVLAAVRGHLDRMKELQRIVAARHKAGQVVYPAEAQAADYYVAEAQTLLAQARVRQKERP